MFYSKLNKFQVDFFLMFLLGIKAEFVRPDWNRCVGDRLDREVLQRWAQTAAWLQQE